MYMKQLFEKNPIKAKCMSVTKQTVELYMKASAYFTFIRNLMA